MLDGGGDQPLFVWTANRYPPLCRSVLSQNTAGAAFRDIQLTTNAINAGSAASGAQKFPFAASAKISLSKVKSDTALRNRSFSF
ncbi:MAG: hypothetical protein FalmKO_35610 [Falsiruegeria mediterranea]